MFHSSRKRSQKKLLKPKMLFRNSQTKEKLMIIEHWESPDAIMKVDKK